MSFEDSITVGLLLDQIQSLAHMMAEAEISEMELPSKTKVSNLQLIEDLAGKAEGLL